MKAREGKPFSFYLWTGLALLVLSWLSELASETETFFPARFINNIWRVGYIIVLNYILFEYSIPFIRRKRSSIVFNILLGIFIGWLHLMFYSYGIYAWRSFGIALNIYTPLKDFNSVEDVVTHNFGFSIGSFFFFGIVRHIHHYVKLRQATQQLMIEKKEAELNFLKSQTNPHFLFNTLNNIYSLARAKSDLAPEAILKLSKILRFMLYETNGDYIAIGQELKIIADYIALEQIRYDDSLHVNFNHDVEDMKQAMPPLLLMPLVENAFKHGASETRNRPFVDIHLSVNKRQLLFIVKNSVDGTSNGHGIKENIGLSNLRRQLELLYAGYDLSTQQTGNTFTASLKINLASHV